MGWAISRHDAVGWVAALIRDGSLRLRTELDVNEDSGVDASDIVDALYASCEPEAQLFAARSLMYNWTFARQAIGAQVLLSEAHKQLGGDEKCRLLAHVECRKTGSPWIGLL